MRRTVAGGGAAAVRARLRQARATAWRGFMTGASVNALEDGRDRSTLPAPDGPVHCPSRWLPPPTRSVWTRRRRTCYTMPSRAHGRAAPLVPGQEPPVSPTLSPRWLTRAALTLLLLGVAARLLRYALRFPIWGDEAFIGLSLLDRDSLALTRQPECRQVAPLLFLWAGRAAVQFLGTSECALRLVPLLAGLGGLLLFWCLARQALSPLAATFAIGLLAVSRWPVTMSANLKPYSLDLFVAVALLLPAARYLA